VQTPRDLVQTQHASPADSCLECKGATIAGAELPTLQAETASSVHTAMRVAFHVVIVASVDQLSR
jgi:hypothetical protein